MEPVVPPDSGKTWSALSIPCSRCGAGAGEHCHGTRLCADRMAILRAMIDSGELGGDVIPPRVSDCPDCHKRRNQTDTKWLACSTLGHRCTSMDRGVKVLRCRRGRNDQMPKSTAPSWWLHVLNRLEIELPRKSQLSEQAYGLASEVLSTGGLCQDGRWQMLERCNPDRSAMGWGQRSQRQTNLSVSPTRQSS